MTEEEWLACSDPSGLGEFLRGRVSERKRRLVASACCRQDWHLLADERSKQAVIAAEKYADLIVSEEERAEAERDANEAARHAGSGRTWFAARSAKMAAARRLPLQLILDRIAPMVTSTQERNVARQQTCEVIRDVVGNPFRPVSVPPHWLTPAVVGLAGGIYDDRAFDRLSILADALLDAGCENDQLLSHCRSAGPHVRGCWVIDLLLGKHEIALRGGEPRTE
jgi:hypothetical protein